MDIFQNVCDYWWLAWILPFILGLAMGWLLFGNMRRIEELEDEVARLRSKNKLLQEDLAASNSAKTEAEDELMLAKNRLRESDRMRNELSEEYAKTKLQSASLQDKYDKLSASVAAAAVATKTTKTEKAKKPATKKSKAKKETTKAVTKATDSTKKAVEKKSPATEETKKTRKVGRPRKTEKVAEKTETKKPRKVGRPRKTEKVEEKAQTTKRKVGRPKKTEKTEVKATETKARRGRPRKTAIAASTPATKPTSTRRKKKSIYDGLKSSNLQVIEGIGPKVEKYLKDNSLKTWKSIASKKGEDIKKVLDKAGSKFRVIDPATWPDQAKLAMAGRWSKLVDVQKGLSGGKEGDKGNLTDAKVEKILIKEGLLKKHRLNDLKAIEGIGPKLESVLKAKGIGTWEALSKAKLPELRAIITEAGPRFRLANPKTWAKQARLAAAGKWEELKTLQDSLDGGK